MTESHLIPAQPVPRMWNVLLFRIRRAEQRERVLGDWETNGFGYRPSSTVLHRERARIRCKG
jgi:hypothetical protein